MAVKRRADRPGSRTYWYDFTVQGHRFRGSCETDDLETAKIVEAAHRNRIVLAAATGRKPDMSLDEAFARYWLEVAHRQNSAGDTKRMAKILLQSLGKPTLLSAISTGRIAEMVAQLRARMADSSVNRHTELLRRVLRRAERVWEVGVRMPHWPDLLLIEPDAPTRTLSQAEEARLFQALRTDFHPLVRFCLLSGVRISEARNLKWRDVLWEDRAIRIHGKSRRPGGAVGFVLMTDAIAAILSVERGRHPDHVFTYECAKNRHDPKRGRMQQKGERRPFTRDGWRRAWANALRAAGIAEFRFHDLRHTFGTRAYSQTRNIKTTQQMIRHSDVQSTLRYIHASAEDVRAGMEALSAAYTPAAGTQEGEAEPQASQARNGATVTRASPGHPVTGKVHKKSKRKAG